MSLKVFYPDGTNLRIRKGDKSQKDVWTSKGT